LAWVALASFAAYVVVVFLGRAVLLRRRTGTSGWHGISGPAGSAAWWGGVLFALALVAALLAPVAALTGVAEPVDVGAGVHALGIALCVLGFAGSLLAQQAMGAWWRVGVDAEEEVELVARGVFARVRNPFFTALLTATAGLLLLVPNAVALGALAALLLAVELQVRVVEEPFLRTQHRDRYRAYAARTGRFLPGVGRDREVAR
jgi:protein-S-isoprenylcysteine O-methyltransferase Ste14